MPRHAEIRSLPYSVEQMYDLVADVGRYQEFLPWVVATRIRQRDERSILADLIVGFGPLRETFTSRVALDRPKTIDVDYVEGPLKRLHNSWKFKPDGEGRCLVDFCVDFTFRSRTFEAIAGRMFGEAVRKMVAAFETRAAKLYGAGAGEPGISSSSAQSAA
jgi:coenzyme Q-binding protein COQ10